MCEYLWSCKVCLVHTWENLGKHTRWILQIFWHAHNAHFAHCIQCTVSLVHTWAGFEICNQRSPILCAWTLWTILWLDCADVFLIVHTWLVRYYFHISSTHFHFFIIRYSFILCLLSPLAQWQDWRGIIFYVCPGRVYTSTYSSILSHPLLSEHIGGNLWSAVDWDISFWDKFGNFWQFFDIFWPIWQFFRQIWHLLTTWTIFHKTMWHWTALANFAMFSFVRQWQCFGESHISLPPWKDTLSAPSLLDYTRNTSFSWKKDT